MERSETLNELAAALCAAQAEIEDASKAKVNPAFRSKYADLGAIWDAAKPALVKHGLSVAQLFVPSEPGYLALETVLMHKSGQFVSGIMTMPLQKQDPQGFGSATTYARRYALAAMVGVCPEDDDANAATGRNGHSDAAPRQPRTESTATKVARVMEEQGKAYPGTDPEAARKRGANAHFAWQNEHGLDDKAAQSVCSAALGRHVESRKTLTAEEWGRVNAYCKSLRPDEIAGLKIASVA